MKSYQIRKFGIEHRNGNETYIMDFNAKQIFHYNAEGQCNEIYSNVLYIIEGRNVLACVYFFGHVTEIYRMQIEPEDADVILKSFPLLTLKQD